MTLADKFSSMSNETISERDSVILEIVNKFSVYFETKAFEDYLQHWLSPEKLAKRESYVSFEFWKYYSGCSETRFAGGGCIWNHPTARGFEADKYKGVYLKSIQSEVLEKIALCCKRRLHDLGFKYVSCSITKDNLDNLTYNVYYRW